MRHLFWWISSLPLWCCRGEASYLHDKPLVDVLLSYVWLEVWGLQESKEKLVYELERSIQAISTHAEIQSTVCGTAFEIIINITTAKMCTSDAHRTPIIIKSILTLTQIYCYSQSYLQVWPGSLERRLILLWIKLCPRGIG